MTERMGIISAPGCKSYVWCRILGFQHEISLIPHISELDCWYSRRAIVKPFITHSISRVTIAQLMKMISINVVIFITHLSSSNHTSLVFIIDTSVRASWNTILITSFIERITWSRPKSSRNYTSLIAGWSRSKLKFWILRITNFIFRSLTHNSRNIDFIATKV